MIAETNPPPLDKFNLSPSEDVYFRARSAKIVDQLARRSSTFKTYYKLPTARPFGYVVGLSAIVAISAFSAACFIFFGKHNPQTYSLVAACLTAVVVSIGWAVAGGITHRNTVRQNTNNLLFARFSQAPFGEAMGNFHRAFGRGYEPVTMEMVTALSQNGDDESKRAASSVTYLLNYYEFIAAGVLHGDFDQRIIKANIRGVICYYYDKCAPYIFSSRAENPRTFEHLIKLRTHYREP